MESRELREDRRPLKGGGGPGSMLPAQEGEGGQQSRQKECQGGPCQEKGASTYGGRRFPGKIPAAVCYKVRTVSELHRFNAFEVFLVVEVVVDAAEHLAGIAHGVVNLIGFFKVACRFLQNGVDFG